MATRRRLCPVATQRRNQQTDTVDPDDPDPKEAPARERILRAAEELFAANGFQATPTSRIAERANVPKGLVHYYFRRKDDLLQALVERLPIEPLTSERLVVPGDVTATLGRLVAELDRTHASSAVLSHLLWREADTHPAVRTVLDARFERVTEQIREVLTATVGRASNAPPSMPSPHWSLWPSATATPSPATPAARPTTSTRSCNSSPKRSRRPTAPERICASCIGARRLRVARSRCGEGGAVKPFRIGDSGHAAGTPGGWSERLMCATSRKSPAGPERPGSSSATMGATVHHLPPADRPGGDALQGQARGDHLP